MRFLCVLHVAFASSVYFFRRRKTLYWFPIQGFYEDSVLRVRSCRFPWIPMSAFVFAISRVLVLQRSAKDMGTTSPCFFLVFCRALPVWLRTKRGYEVGGLIGIRIDHGLSTGRLFTDKMSIYSSEWLRLVEYTCNERTVRGKFCRNRLRICRFLMSLCLIFLYRTPSHTFFYTSPSCGDLVLKRW